MDKNFNEKDLNEKECPYCGGGIEFSINDKIIKCPYCNKEIDVSRFNPETIIKTEEKHYDVKGKTNVVYHGDKLKRREIFFMGVMIVLVIIGTIYFGINMKRDYDISSKYEEISSKNIDYDFLNNLHEKSKKKVEEEASSLNTFHIVSNTIYKSYIYNTQKINSKGYNKENDLFDVLKVIYSNGSEQVEVYQCVSHNGIFIKDGVISFEKDDPTYFLKEMSLGSIQKGTFNDLKVEFNDNEFVYGSKNFNEIYDYIMNREEWDKWNYYSILEIDG